MYSVYIVLQSLYAHFTTFHNHFQNSFICFDIVELSYWNKSKY